MENKYEYFERDISWLSFNKRVLLEAEDKNLPLYERINFVSIYSSNLEEFYRVRVADYIAQMSEAEHCHDMEKMSRAMITINKINDEVNSQLETRVRIFEKIILPELEKRNVVFYQSRNVLPEHREFVNNFFREEIFPYLSPIPVRPNTINTFLRDNRVYLAVRMHSQEVDKNSPFYTQYFVIKMPYGDVPRFIELPKIGKTHYIMYCEDIVKANLDIIFPGYKIESSYSIKISRDADIYTEKPKDTNELIRQVKETIKKRKIGAVSRFVYDRFMPDDFLEYLRKAYGIKRNELVPGDKHLNMEDLKELPCPMSVLKEVKKPQPFMLTRLDKENSIFKYIDRKDLMLYYPYHSFQHFVHFLYEAVHDKTVAEIRLSQYRVAENSEVINALIAAAQNGKKVTVFVELKARFDEANNLATAEMMRKAGINIIYSLPGLKVHAKVALVLKKKEYREQGLGYAFISTGNFNENTATVYADCGMFTSDNLIVKDVKTLFSMFKGKENLKFYRLLVTRSNLMEELAKYIDNEISISRQGGHGRIILKMNGLQDKKMISHLYRASEAGVEIDLIVRGICCLKPGQEYSKNIRVTRIVDSFLEHSRIWYFANEGGKRNVFIGSPDWMHRNLYRRIEAVTPVLDEDIKDDVVKMLEIQLSDKRKACFIDGNLNNVWKSTKRIKEKSRAQYDFYEYLKEKEKRIENADFIC